jgi:RNA polymerase sigma-70 factor (ECF subfamily)
MASETSLAAESADRQAEPHALATEERALLAAVLQKDRKAAGEFVSRYAGPVYVYVSRRLAPRADLAEDVVQDVFLAALQKLDTFEGQSSVVGWLLGIARHKVEDIYRARVREPDPFPDDAATSNRGPAIEPHLDELIDAARVQEKTRRILDRLPVAYSAALLWRYWEKRSIKDMAAQTGKTEKAIERRLARARAHFRQLWEAE